MLPPFASALPVQREHAMSAAIRVVGFIVFLMDGMI
jgi:hypothetical protein